MKNIIQDLNDITDSKEMLEAKPHPFTTIFIYILIAILLVSLAWAWFGEIDIVIKANGVVRPTESIISIKNQVSGIVADINIADGKKVNQGDIIYIINHDNLLVEKNLLESQLKELELEISNLNKLKESIKTKNNLFNKDSKDEIDYYFRYMKYETDYTNLMLQKNKSSAELDEMKKNNKLNVDNFSLKLNETETNIDGLNSLKDSILKDETLFTENQSIYEQQFLDYKSKIVQYENDLSLKKLTLDDLLNKKKQNESALQDELSSAKITLESIQLQLEDYEIKYMADLHSSINQNNATLNEIWYAKKSSATREDILDDELYYLYLLKESIEDDSNKFDMENDDEMQEEYLDMYYSYNSDIRRLENAVKNLERYIESTNNEIDDKTSLIQEKERTLVLKKQELVQAEENNNLELISILKSEIKLLEDTITIEENEITILTSTLNKYIDDLDVSKENLLSYENSYMQELNKSIRTSEDSRDVISSDLGSKSSQEKNLKEINENLLKLEESIEKNNNLFSDENTEYYNRYEQYEIGKNRLLNEIELKIQAVENINKKIHDFDVNMEKEIKGAEISLRNSENILQNYKNTYLLDIDKKLHDSTVMVSDYETNIEKYQENNALYTATNDYNHNTVEKFEMDTLVSIDDSIKTNEETLEQLNKNLDSLNLSIEECIVKAPVDGVLNVIREVNNGELLEMGAEVATIISDKDDYYKVELFVSNQDIAKLEADNEIKYNFHALPYKEYGYLSGKITTIGVDSKVDQSSGVNYYSVESKMKNIPVYSYKGDEAEIKIGMTCEAQIITERKKIIYFLLEKINLKD